jgi:hypothetical protein
LFQAPGLRGVSGAGAANHLKDSFDLKICPSAIRNNLQIILNVNDSGFIRDPDVAVIRLLSTGIKVFFKISQVGLIDITRNVSR